MRIKSPDAANTRPLTPASVTQATGHVGRPHESGWWVRLGAREVIAVQATSCLVEPRLGDWVCVLHDPSDGHYITDVLRRADDAPVQISVGRPLRIEAPSVEITTRELNVAASVARFALGHATAIGRRLASSFDTVTHVGKALDLLVEAVVQKSGSSVRSVVGLDRTEAGTIEQQATADHRLSAKRSLINGRDVVKIDGAQVQLG